MEELSTVKETLSSSRNYSDELIKLFLSVSYKSSMAYLTALTLYTVIFVAYVPQLLFYLLVSIHIIYQVLRFYFILRFKNKKLDAQQKHDFVKWHTTLMLFGGIAWGTSSAIAIFYSPSSYEYVMLFIIIAMVAGSISTLSSIYRTYLAFNIPMIAFITVAFLFSTGELSLYIALVIPIFSYEALSSAWEMHLSLKRSLELSELYAISQKELKEINSSLEEKVKQGVDENRRKDKQMLAQSRLAQMGEMISMIAHQWRQPLSAVTATTGNISLHMHLDKCDKKLINENLEKINSYTQYLSTTINDFRDFFKPDKKKEKTTLNDIVKGSLNIVEPTLKSDGIGIETSLNASEEIYSYPNELKQVVLNLLKNSKDIYSEQEIEKKTITISTYIKDKHAVLEVCDVGGGVTPEDLPFIFDPYFTTKEKRDGTGLGLYMSKLIIEEHCGGSLNVENKTEGACFSFTLPLQE